MKTIQVELNSLAPLMFNTFRGQEEIPPERKLNLLNEDGITVILPGSNILGFLTSRLVGRSCINTFVDSRQRPERQAEVMASVSISPVEIPILGAGNKPIKFDGSWDGQVYIDERAAQASKTARVMARRPTIRMPWSVQFTMSLAETDFVTEERMRDWFVNGGLMVGLGAFRPFFGRFSVARWEVSE